MQIISEHYIEKLRQMRYLNRGIVFACDLFFSILGTALSYVYIITFLGNWVMTGSIITVLLSSAVISMVLFMSTGLYKVIIRHSTLKDLPRVFYILLGKEAFMVLVLYLVGITMELVLLCAILDLLITTFLMIGVRAIIVNAYYSILHVDDIHIKNVFVYSTEGGSPLLVAQINNNSRLPYKVVGLLTTNKKKNGIRISGETVHYIGVENEKLQRLFTKKKVKAVIFVSNENFNRERDRLVEFCIANHIQIFMAGKMRNLGDSKKNHQADIKPIQIEELLNREEIKLDTDSIENLLSCKTILVTGAAGSIGREIVLQLASLNVKRLILLDNSETPLHYLQLEIEDNFPNAKVEYCLGDVRSKERVKGLFTEYKPNMVFHAAAYKHVPMIERNPCESVLANVWGTMNMAIHASEFGVERFVMISTDKAVNPTNVMGASKRIAELYVQYMNRNSDTKYITTRFGNVLGSNGSVIPRFKEQIAAGGPVTVTHPDIIRYFMTIPEACRLVLQAATMGDGGEIFVFDMGEQVKIADLARKMISLSGLVPDRDIEIKYTGLRPGEKLYEELLSNEELTDATQHKKIRIAHVTQVDDEILFKNLRSLIKYALAIDRLKTAKLMKVIVPEFQSKNSEFEICDKQGLKL